MSTIAALETPVELIPTVYNTALAFGDSDAYSTNLKYPQRGTDVYYLLDGGAILNHGQPTSWRCHCQWRVS